MLQLNASLVSVATQCFLNHPAHSTRTEAATTQLVLLNPSAQATQVPKQPKYPSSLVSTCLNNVDSARPNLRSPQPSSWNLQLDGSPAFKLESPAGWVPSQPDHDSSVLDKVQALECIARNSIGPAESVPTIRLDESFRGVTSCPSVAPVECNFCHTGGVP